MAYYFFFGSTSWGAIPLPVTPGALNIKTPSKNTTVTLINDGEINIPKEQGLREISFEFMLPQQKYPFANYTLFKESFFDFEILGQSLANNYTATTLIPLLNKLKKLKKPFQFVVTRMNPKNKILFFTNIQVLIEDFDYDEDADANGFDVMCNITLKEYRPYGTKYNKIIESTDGKKVAQQTTQRTTTKTTPKTYTVKKGDTLWNICKKQLGDGSKYKEVAKLNKLANPNLIYPDQVLRLS